MRSAFILALLLGPIAALATPKNFDVQIEGMTCGSCVNSVTKALAKIPGADEKSIKVVLKEKKATLTLNDATPEAIAGITKAIEGAGYTVTSVNAQEVAAGKDTAPETKSKKKN